MELSSTPKKKFVDDYDFIFTSGLIKPVTIDPTLGDTIEFISEGVVINIKERPSLSDPSESISAEDITIFAKHLICIEHRKRQVEELTPEQKYEYQRTFQEMSKTIN